MNERNGRGRSVILQGSVLDGHNLWVSSRLASYLLDPEGPHGALLVHPGVLAVGTSVDEVAVATHDGLDDRGEGRDTNARPNQHGVLRGEDAGAGSAVRTLDVHLATIQPYMAPCHTAVL